MESNPQKSEYTESDIPEIAAAQTEKLKEAQEHRVEVNVEQPSAIAQLPPADRTTDQAWQEWVQPILDFVAKLPGILIGFYYEYQQSILVVGLALAGLISVYITLAVLDAINDIPLLAPIFELVGIGYTIWFVARYLWKAESRKELAAEFNSLKGQLLGKDSIER